MDLMASGRPQKQSESWTEKAGVVHPEAKKAPGRSHCGLSVLTGGL